jgi:hypothetical protein
VTCHDRELTTGEILWMFINMRPGPLQAMRYAVLDVLGSCLCQIPGRFDLYPVPHSCTLCRATLMPWRENRLHG